MVVALAVVVFLQVFNRFVLKAPLAWSEDLAMLLFQWVAFLGAAIGVRRMRHFGIELVVKKLPEKVHRRIELIIPGKSVSMPGRFKLRIACSICSPNAWVDADDSDIADGC